MTAYVCVDRREPQEWLSAPHTLLLILHHYTLQWLLHTAHRTLHARCSNVPYPPAAPIFIPIHTYRTRPQPACTACLLCNIPKHHLKKTDRAPSAYPITHPATHSPTCEPPRIFQSSTSDPPTRLSARDRPPLQPPH